MIDFQDVATTNSSQHFLLVLSKLLETVVTDSTGVKEKSKTKQKNNTTISVFEYILRKHSHTNSALSEAGRLCWLYHVYPVYQNIWSTVQVDEKKMDVNGINERWSEHLLNQ